jgi:copper homeostasis protein
MKNLEIACFNYESALIAQQGGANRVELCASYQDGGLTPDPETVNQTMSNLHIEVYVMIRPRAGNFVYSPAEFEQMKSSIKQLQTI